MRNAGLPLFLSTCSYMLFCVALTTLTNGEADKQGSKQRFNTTHVCMEVHSGQVHGNLLDSYEGYGVTFAYSHWNHG
jgi:hypothetical protein